MDSTSVALDLFRKTVVYNYCFLVKDEHGDIYAFVNKPTKDRIADGWISWNAAGTALEDRADVTAFESYIPTLKELKIDTVYESDEIFEVCLQRAHKEKGEQTMNVNVKKLSEDAVVPTYGSEGAAAFDLYAAEDTGVFAPTLISTGLAFEVPKGYALIVVPRSSTGLKTLLRMPHSMGVIDSDYRGEVKVMYEAESPTVVEKGTRIAQGMIVPVMKVNLKEVKELSETKRGNGGFGSTGE